MCRCQTSAFPVKEMPTNPLHNMSPTYDLHCLSEEDNNITVQEDDTCLLLSIEMPNVHENDVQISLRKNVLTISGFRRSKFYSNPGSSDDESDERRVSMDRTSTKRQRLSRQLEIDPNSIDIDRAMASTWNGFYTLYAPKRRPPFR